MESKNRLIKCCLSCRFFENSFDDEPCKTCYLDKINPFSEWQRSLMFDELKYF